MNKYAEIMSLSYTPSLRHPRMSIENRAAQFAPYAALVGYDGLIEEANRLTLNKVELNEDELAMLNVKLLYLEENKDVLGTFTYFVKDDKKEGGTYKEHNAYLYRVDNDLGLVVLSDGTKIVLDDLVKITY